MVVKITLNQNNERLWLMVCAGYALAVMAIGAYLNYTIPYETGPVTTPPLVFLLTWSLLYAPLFGIPILAKKDVVGFGFSINPFSLLASIFMSALCAPIVSQISTSWIGALSEAFARTGEELFFRGFLFGLFLKVFDRQHKPWLWATILSSVLFALVHTQTFQPGYIATQGAGPAAFIIIQRLLNVALAGFILALLRYWTKSILPGAIAHGMVQGGLLTLPFVLLIHGAILVWALARKEHIISGFPQKIKNET